MDIEPKIEPKKEMDSLEVELRKPKKRNKKDKVNFNITFEEKDVIIFFK
jgi:hypothetical protein